MLIPQYINLIKTATYFRNTSWPTHLKLAVTEGWLRNRVGCYENVIRYMIIVIRPHHLPTAYPGWGRMCSSPDVPLPNHFHQLLRGNPKALPGQLGDTISPVLGVPGSPPRWISLNHLSWVLIFKIEPTQLTEKTHLAASMHSLLLSLTIQTLWPKVRVEMQTDW